MPNLTDADDGAASQDPNADSYVDINASDNGWSSDEDFPADLSFTVSPRSDGNCLNEVTCSQIVTLYQLKKS